MLVYMEEDERRELQSAFVRARVAVVDHWRSRQEQGHEPSEEEQTVVLCGTAYPQVEYAQFNRQQEARLGADWLWWFLDASGECFGILIQAKKLRRTGSGWRIDLDYRSGGRPQMYKLLDTADHFSVPAAYLLYSGDAEYRRGLSCGLGHLERYCAKCERSAVTALSGPCAKVHGRLSKDSRGRFSLVSPT